MRSLNLKCKNNQSISDTSFLSLDLKDLDLSMPKNNWQKHLAQGKEKGYKKVFLQLKSLAPLFRVEYSIYFDNKDNLENFNDPLFLRYIIPNYFEKISTEIPQDLDCSIEHPLGFSCSNQEIKTNKEYITKNIPNYLKFEKPINSLKINTLIRDGFILDPQIIPLKDEGVPYTNDDLFNDGDLTPYSLLIDPSCDSPYSILKDIFSKDF